MPGDWSIVSQAEDGKSLSKEELLARKCSFRAGHEIAVRKIGRRHGQSDFSQGFASLMERSNRKALRYPNIHTRTRAARDNSLLACSRLNSNG